MITKQVVEFHECFELVEYPRVGGRCDHPLDAILFFVVTAVIAGAEGPATIEQLRVDKEDSIKAEYSDQKGPLLVQIDGKTARGSYTDGDQSD